jgi:hypothetical protein
MKTRFPQGAKQQDVGQGPEPSISASSEEPLTSGPAPQPAIPQVFTPDVPEAAKPGAFQRARSLLRVRVPTPDLKWNQKVVTVSLEKDVVRVVTFKGKRVTGWKTTDISQRQQAPEPEDGTAVEYPSVSPLQSILDDLGIKYGGRLWKTLDKMGFRRGRVVMDLSLYTTLMRHLQIPKVRLRYLEPVVVSEVLESLPFSKDEVDISWQLHKEEEGQWVYAIALPKQRVDSQVKLVKDLWPDPGRRLLQGIGAGPGRWNYRWHTGAPGGFRDGAGPGQLRRAQGGPPAGVGQWRSLARRTRQHSDPGYRASSRLLPAG